MAAHGIPVVPPAPFAISSATDREYIESTTTNIIDTVSKIAKEAGKMFKDVPYIKALAGIVIQIISIKEVREISGERNDPTTLVTVWLDLQKFKRRSDRSQKLIDKVLRRSKVILDALLRVGSSPNRDQLKDIKCKLKDYNVCGLQFYPFFTIA